MWNPEDVFRLRQQFRIVGSLVGNFPKQSRERNGLPLLLSPPEVQLLKEKGVVRLVEMPGLVRPPQSQAVSQAEEYREQSYQEQIETLREERKKAILGLADKIVAGKRRKLLQEADSRKRACLPAEPVLGEEEQPHPQDGGVPEDSPLPEIDREDIISQEIARIQPIARSQQIIQIFTSHPWSSGAELTPAVWTYPGAGSVLDKCRLFAFKDLWNHGYYLSEGSKFGADFLVYQGDPMRFHAKYLVICIESLERDFPEHRPQELVGRCRLGTTVTKTVLLAWLQRGGEVRYKSLRRAGETVRQLVTFS